ncbi:uncharacterized protein LOC131432867 [Malaya genurostris]|uniref:uncharacterized protein LOC131432867 n=1 Tax=Malaya genurostris TaxID=325434 RepID=UPI0026F3E25B|nr:uncharacterized protein LOC131432867 [Malaya genurostris]
MDVTKKHHSGDRTKIEGTDTKRGATNIGITPLEHDNGAVEIRSNRSPSPPAIIITRNRKSKRDLQIELKNEKSRNAILMKEIEMLREANKPSGSASDLALVGNNVKANGSDFDGNNASSNTPRPENPIGQDESMFMTSFHQLSISSLNVPECLPLTESEGIQRHSYEMWRDMLVDSMELAGINDERTKFIVFKVKAGQRLLEIFKNTSSDSSSPDPDQYPFSNALYRLKNYFGSGSDVMLQKRKLAVMVQKLDESDLSYISRVGATARMCNFGNDKEFEQIASTIAEHARNKDVRISALRILSRKGTFTDLVDEVRELEAIRINEEFIMNKQAVIEPVKVAVVRADYPRNTQMYGRTFKQLNQNKYNSRLMYTGNRVQGNKFRGRRETARFYNQSQTNRCWRCNSVYHLPSECNALNKVCRNCGKMGHILRACSSTFAEPISRKRPNSVEPTGDHMKKLAAIEGPISEDINDSEVGEPTE